VTFSANNAPEPDAALPATEPEDPSLVMWRALAAIPVVAVLVVVFTPVGVLRVGGDVGKRRLLRFGRQVRLRIARLGHTSIVGGAWMERGGRPRASGPAIEEATP
jgi:hypothetical protein